MKKINWTMIYIEVILTSVMIICGASFLIGAFNAHNTLLLIAGLLFALISLPVTYCTIGKVVDEFTSKE